jgi:hypothetical protein
MDEIFCKYSFRKKLFFKRFFYFKVKKIKTINIYYFIEKLILIIEYI